MTTAPANGERSMMLAAWLQSRHVHAWCCIDTRKHVHEGSEHPQPWGWTSDSRSAGAILSNI